MPGKVWDEIFIEVWEKISNFIPPIIMEVITWYLHGTWTTCPITDLDYWQPLALSIICLTRVQESLISVKWCLCVDIFNIKITIIIGWSVLVIMTDDYGYTQNKGSVELSQKYSPMLHLMNI